VEPSHREPDDFTGPVGRNQPHSVWRRAGCGTWLSTAATEELPHTHTHAHGHTHTDTADLLYTERGHGGFPQEAGLEVAQDLLHTLDTQTTEHVTALYL